MNILVNMEKIPLFYKGNYQVSVYKVKSLAQSFANVAFVTA